MSHLKQEKVLYQKGENTDSDAWDDEELIAQYDESMQSFKASLGIGKTNSSSPNNKAKKPSNTKARPSANEDLRRSRAQANQRLRHITHENDSFSHNKDLDDMMHWLEWMKPVDAAPRSTELDPWRAGDRCWAPYHRDGLMYPASVVRMGVTPHEPQRPVATVEFFGWQNRVVLDIRWLRPIIDDWRKHCPDRHRPPGRPAPPAVRRALLAQFPHLTPSKEEAAAEPARNGFVPPPPPHFSCPPPPPPPAVYPRYPPRTCACAANDACAGVSLADLLRTPPPLPPAPPLPDNALRPGQEVTSALLNSWYTCGFKSGYLQGYLEARRELLTAEKSC